MISVILINSRSDKHPDWVQLAKGSVLKQTIDCELIVVDNIGRIKTIGQCWNEGIEKAKFDYVLFLGDDDWLAEDYCSSLIQYALNYPNYIMWTTNMTAYSEDTKLYAPLQRICTGMWKKEYLLKYPFNKELLKGVDREYIEEMKKRGDVGFTINHNFGYYYRKHSDYSSSGQITFVKDKPQIYVLSSYRSFIDPLIKEWKKNKKVFVSSEEFDPLLAEEAEIIWCEWLSENAIKVAEHKCKSKKILRLHSYEAFSPLIHYVNFSKFDKIIFIVDHIKRYVESKVGKLNNAVVIPVGVDLNKFTIGEIKNVKYVAYAGQISRKKGAGELILIANSFPDYEFFVAGKFVEDDVAVVFNENIPENIHLEPYSYNLNEFFRNKSFIINTSLREGNPVTVLEGMSAGLFPIVNSWIGAKDIFNGYTYKNFNQLNILLHSEPKPSKYREFVKNNYNFENTLEKINSNIF